MERRYVLQRDEDVPVQLDVRDVVDVAVRREDAVLVLAAEQGDLDLLALVLVRVVLDARTLAVPQGSGARAADGANGAIPPVDSGVRGAGGERVVSELQLVHAAIRQRVGRGLPDAVPPQRAKRPAVGDDEYPSPEPGPRDALDRRKDPREMLLACLAVVVGRAPGNRSSISDRVSPDQRPDVDLAQAADRSRLETSCGAATISAVSRARRRSLE